MRFFDRIVTIAGDFLYPHVVEVHPGTGVFGARDWCCEKYGPPAPWIRKLSEDRWTWNESCFVFRNYYDAFEFKMVWG